MTAELPALVAETLADSLTYHVDFERSTGYNDDEVRTERPADQCNAVTSEKVSGPFAGSHRLLLDIDIPAALIPSSTPGHSHLYVDAHMTRDQLDAVLDALANAGVIESGFANASHMRGHTALRMPHIRKETPA